MLKNKFNKIQIVNLHLAGTIYDINNKVKNRIEKYIREYYVSYQDVMNLEGFKFGNNYGLFDIQKMDKQEMKIGFINSNGVVVVEPLYFIAGYLKEQPYKILKLNNKMGIIDINGILRIPLEYDEMDFDFSEGLLAVKRNGKIGFLNEKLEIVIPLIYENGDKPVYRSTFKNATSKLTLNGKKVTIDNTGKVLNE